MLLLKACRDKGDVITQEDEKEFRQIAELSVDQGTLYCITLVKHMLDHIKRLLTGWQFDKDETLARVKLILTSSEGTSVPSAKSKIATKLCSVPYGTVPA